MEAFDDNSGDIVKYLPKQLGMIYSEAVQIFNEKPSKALEFLLERKVVNDSPRDFTGFIISQPKLSKRRIGEYISGLGEPNQTVCALMFSTYNFNNMSLDEAIRFLVRKIRLPGEAQQIDRIMEKFALSYHEQNPSRFTSADTAYVLSVSLIMLNTDLHNPSIPQKKRMTLDQFIRNNRGLDGGQDLPRDYLSDLYQRIKSKVIIMDEADMYESHEAAFVGPTKAGWLKKKSSGFFASWDKRWFILKDSCLYYFSSPLDKAPRFILPMEDVKVAWGREYSKNWPENLTEIVITSNTNTYLKAGKLLKGSAVSSSMNRERMVLLAATKQENDDWFRHLSDDSIRFSPQQEVVMFSTPKKPSELFKSRSRSESGAGYSVVGLNSTNPNNNSSSSSASVGSSNSGKSMVSSHLPPLPKLLGCTDSAEGVPEPPPDLQWNRAPGTGSFSTDYSDEVSSAHSSVFEDRKRGLWHTDSDKDLQQAMTMLPADLTAASGRTESLAGSRSRSSSFKTSTADGGVGGLVAAEEFSANIRAEFLRRRSSRSRSNSCVEEFLLQLPAPIMQGWLWISAVPCEPEHLAFGVLSVNNEEDKGGCSVAGLQETRTSPTSSLPTLPSFASSSSSTSSSPSSSSGDSKAVTGVGQKNRWSQKYFVLFPDFDGGGETLFYFVSDKSAVAMMESGRQTQQGFLRMNAVHEICSVSTARLPVGVGLDLGRTEAFPPWRQLLQIQTDANTLFFGDSGEKNLQRWIASFRCTAAAGCLQGI